MIDWIPPENQSHKHKAPNVIIGDLAAGGNLLHALRSDKESPFPHFFIKFPAGADKTDSRKKFDHPLEMRTSKNRGS